MSSYLDKKNKKETKFRFSFVILFIIASFAGCFVMYMRSDGTIFGKSEESGMDELTVISETSAEVDEQFEERDSTADINPIAESEKLDKVYFEKCMFAGDSLIVGLGTYGIIPEEQIAANIGMSVMSITSTPLVEADGTEILAADKINSRSPENLYILLGLNLLGSYTDEQLLASYGDFIDSIDRTNTNIYVISVPPVTGERETNEENPILNSDIDSFNSDLLKFANNKCIYYIDLNTALKGSDGRMPEEYAEADGIHFKKSTYDVMLDYLLTHVYMQ